MKALRPIALAGLVLVTIGVVGHCVDPAARRESPPLSKPAPVSLRPPPLPIAEAAAVAAWTGPAAPPTGVTASACAPLGATRARLTARTVIVKVLCRATVQIDGTATAAGLVWTVGLSWTAKGWVLRGFSP